jgi:hypothetical protein
VDDFHATIVLVLLLSLYLLLFLLLLLLFCFNILTFNEGKFNQRGL